MGCNVNVTDSPNFRGIALSSIFHDFLTICSAEMSGFLSYI